MGQSSAQLTILHRSPAKVNTVNYLFCSPTPDPAREWSKGQKVNCRKQAISLKMPVRLHPQIGIWRMIGSLQLCPCVKRVARLH